MCVHTTIIHIQTSSSIYFTTIIHRENAYNIMHINTHPLIASQVSVGMFALYPMIKRSECRIFFFGALLLSRKKLSQHIIFFVYVLQEHHELPLLSSSRVLKEFVFRVRRASLASYVYMRWRQRKKYTHCENI